MVENWDQYKDLEYYPDRVCACGCGGRIKVQSHHKYYGIPKYICGHHRKGSRFSSPNTRGENNPAKRPEVREKLRRTKKWNKGLTKETDLRVAGQAEKLRGRKFHTKESKEKIGEFHRGVKQPDSQRKKNSESKERLWKAPEFIAKQIKARNIGPNKPEKLLLELLQKLFPNEWKYVGCGDFFVAGTNKNPDFVHVNQKKIIEHFGDFWHGEGKTGIPNEQHEQERIDLFIKYGYQTLIIWEHELKDIDVLIEKLILFCKG